MSLETELGLQHIFYADRPLMKKYSQDSVFIARSVRAEVEELNGHETDNMSVTDYRAQEISDVKFFSLAIVESEGLTLSQGNIDAFAAPYRAKLSSVTDANREEYYLATKEKLEKKTHSLLEGWVRKRLAKKEKLVSTLEEILALATVLHEILGRDSETEMRDKLARNMLKYRPENFSDVNGDYPSEVHKSGRRWAREGKTPGRGNPGFYEHPSQYTSDLRPDKPIKTLTIESALAEYGLTIESLAAVPLEFPEPELEDIVSDNLEKSSRKIPGHRQLSWAYHQLMLRVGTETR